MNKHHPTAFDLNAALAGTWVSHLSPLYNAHRLQVHVEGKAWIARVTNPGGIPKQNSPYIKRSLGKVNEMDASEMLARAAAFYHETFNPIIAGPTFAGMLQDYIDAGCPCKQRGAVLGPREVKAQGECARLLRRAAKLIGDTPLSSDLWEDAAAGIADKVGGAENYRKTSGFIRALLTWAKKVKKLKVGDLPERGPNLRGKRASMLAHEYARILRAAGPGWLHEHMRFLRHTGVRPGDEIEIAAIRFRHIAEVSADGWVEVYVAKPKTDTRLKSQIAYADKELLDVVAAIKQMHPTPDDPDALVFPPQNYGRMFRRVLRALQAAEPSYPWEFDGKRRKRSLYSIRHYHATERASQRGRWNIDNLALHLGNTPEVCREYYIDQNEELIRASMPAAA